jgi:hypothetical protein
MSNFACLTPKTPRQMKTTRSCMLLRLCGASQAWKSVIGEVREACFVCLRTSLSLTFSRSLLPLRTSPTPFCDLANVCSRR